jgi:hypothetical protein
MSQPDTLPDANGLRMWVLYENPSDWPGMFVLREWLVLASGAVPMPGVFMSPTPENLRAQMEDMGLTCLPRSVDDQAHIVECWL